MPPNVQGHSKQKRKNFFELLDELFIYNSPASIDILKPTILAIINYLTDQIAIQEGDIGRIENLLAKFKRNDLYLNDAPLFKLCKNKFLDVCVEYFKNHPSEKPTDFGATKENVDLMKYYLGCVEQKAKAGKLAFSFWGSCDSKRTFVNEIDSLVEEARTCGLNTEEIKQIYEKASETSFAAARWAKAFTCCRGQTKTQEHFQKQISNLQLK